MLHRWVRALLIENSYAGSPLCSSVSFCSIFTMDIFSPFLPICLSFSCLHPLWLFRRQKYENLFINRIPCSLASTCLGQWGSLGGDQREGVLRIYCPGSFSAGSCRAGLDTLWTKVHTFWWAAFSLWFLGTTPWLFPSGLWVVRVISGAQGFPALVCASILCPHFVSLSLFKTSFDPPIFSVLAVSSQHTNWHGRGDKSVSMTQSWKQIWIQC